MKTFQKIALVSAIATAPFAAQAMEALDDTVLGNTTGQAGVTIELSIGDAGISIGEIVYTDTSHNVQVNDDQGDAPGTTDYEETLEARDGGSVGMQNLIIKDLTGLTQTIDVNEGGDLVMTTSAAENLKISLGGIDVNGDSIGNKSAVTLRSKDGSQVAEIVDSLNMQVDLGASTTTVMNLAGVGDTLALAGVQGTAASGTSSVAIVMDATFRIDDLDAEIFGYTQEQASAKVEATALDADASADVSKDSDGKFNNATLQASADKLANGGAVTITDLTFDNDGGYVTADQIIWADETGVSIQIGSIAGDLSIGSIGIGGASIGSVTVSDINLAGMTQKIYGH